MSLLPAAESDALVRSSTTMAITTPYSPDATKVPDSHARDPSLVAFLKFQTSLEELRIRQDDVGVEG